MNRCKGQKLQYCVKNYINAASIALGETEYGPHITARAETELEHLLGSSSGASLDVARVGDRGVSAFLRCGLCSTSLQIKPVPVAIS